MNWSFFIAQLFGTFALIILIYSLQKNEKESLLKLQVLSSLFYAFQYLFLKAYSGFLMNLVCAIRNVYFHKQHNKSILSFVFLLFIICFLSYLSYDGIWSILPTVAVIVFTISLMQNRLTFIRIAEIIACILGVIYSIKVNAITGLITQIIELSASIIAFYRFDIKKKS